MEKEIIGIDISNQPDRSYVRISFLNNGQYDKSAINQPITYKDNVVGAVTDVDDTFVNGYLFDMKFYKEQFMDGCIAGVSVEFGKKGNN